MSNEWKVLKPVDFYTFREKLANQMLQYSPQDRKCPGDEKFRVSTRQPKSKRKHANVASKKNVASASTSVQTAVTTCSNLTRESFGNNTKPLCGDLTMLHKHVESVKATDSCGRICVVCGKRCYSVCVACGDAMHRFPSKPSKKGAAIGMPCFYHHHNTSFFGLSKRGAPVAGTRVKDWTFPSPHRIANHRKDVLHILQPRAIALPPTTPRVNTVQQHLLHQVHSRPSKQPRQQQCSNTNHPLTWIESSKQHDRIRSFANI